MEAHYKRSTFYTYKSVRRFNPFSVVPHVLVLPPRFQQPAPRSPISLLTTKPQYKLVKSNAPFHILIQSIITVYLQNLLYSIFARRCRRCRPYNYGWLKLGTFHGKVSSRFSSSSQRLHLVPQQITTRICHQANKWLLLHVSFSLLRLIYKYSTLKRKRQHITLLWSFQEK